METLQQPVDDRPSLENLVESGMLKLESLHPGGLELTSELIRLCNVRKDTRVLDLASGTGETACFLCEQFAAHVYGVDHSGPMIQQAEAKARAKGLSAVFTRADAVNLPFGDAEFDAAICECTLCFLDKECALREMARVVRPGGYVGMHDLYWKDGTPDTLKQLLADIEHENPETLAGWQQLFEKAGLVHVSTIDRSAVKSRWMNDSRGQLGLAGQFRLGFQIIRRWGLGGLRTVLRSQRVFSNESLGYGIVVGTKP